MNKVNVDAFITSLIRDHSWKSPAIIAAISAALLILLDSFLFALSLKLIKLALLIITIG